MDARVKPAHDEEEDVDCRVKPGRDEKLAHICSSQAVNRRKNP
jgi:hypothetical protein